MSAPAAREMWKEAGLCAYTGPRAVLCELPDGHDGSHVGTHANPRGRRVDVHVWGTGYDYDLPVYPLSRLPWIAEKLEAAATSKDGR